MILKTVIANLQKLTNPVCKLVLFSQYMTYLKFIANYFAIIAKQSAKKCLTLSSMHSGLIVTEFQKQSMFSSLPSYHLLSQFSWFYVLQWSLSRFIWDLDTGPFIHKEKDECLSGSERFFIGSAIFLTDLLIKKTLTISVTYAIMNEY